MSEELQNQQPDQAEQQKVKQGGEAISVDRVDQALEVLDDEGGFDFISSTVQDAENLEPGAMRSVFLNDQNTQKERLALKRRLASWASLLEAHDNVGEMIEASQATGEQSEELLNANIKRALDKTQEMEKSYRTLAAFFANAGGNNPVKNLTIVNAGMDKIMDLDNRRFLKAVHDEFKHKYDRLDLMNTYSLLVIPGFLGDKQVLDEWARTACEHKVMLLTDYRNLDSTDQVMKLFEREQLTGSDEFRANVMMTCNWLVAREQHLASGEEEPLFIPPSAALAGQLYSGNMAQVSAGVQHGVLRSIKGTRFDIFASDLSKLGDMGLIPMAFEFQQVQAMSKSTLFNGTNAGMQTYSVVRTFDWLTKCMMDYLNRKVFTNISNSEIADARKEISKFFDKCVREYKYLEATGKIDVKRDPNYRDRVQIYVNATPYFPAKNFVLRIDGKSGENPGDVNSYDTSVA